MVLLHAAGFIERAKDGGVPGEAVDLIHDGRVPVAPQILKALTAKLPVLVERAAPNLRHIALLKGLFVRRDGHAKDVPGGWPILGRKAE